LEGNLGNSGLSLKDGQLDGGVERELDSLSLKPGIGKKEEEKADILFGPEWLHKKASPIGDDIKTVWKYTRNQMLEISRAINDRSSAEANQELMTNAPSVASEESLSPIALLPIDYREEVRLWSFIAITRFSHHSKQSDTTPANLHAVV
jgi:hypothetical protein